MTAILALLAKLPMWLYILVFAVAVIGAQQWRIRHAHAQLTALQGVANTLHEANVANQATIVALKRANETWAGKYAADVAKASKEAQDATAYAEQQHRAAQSAQKALHDLSQAHPEVRAWADVVVPPSVVRVLTGSQD